MSRIAVAMSGGVDSSVAAALLSEGDREVVGITLQLWDYSEVNLSAGRGRCCSPADIADARRVAARLGIPHYVFDHGDAFRRSVVDPFLRSWAGGRTPSPCITCNRKIKFDLLWELARGLGADELATGHYARLDHPDGHPRLRRALDRDKDQSYFLFDVLPGRLDGVRFPLGALSKEQARDVARRHRLPVADKPESYELCFIPDGDKDAFVERHGRSGAAGAIRHVDGRDLGTHDGIHRFTVGQRRGLGIAGNEPLYVVDIDRRGAVTVGPEEELYVRGLEARPCNWLVSPPTSPFRARARIRHRHPAAPCTVEPGDDVIRVRFDEPQRAVAPGQGLALYDDDRLLGGGWIDLEATKEDASSAATRSRPARLTVR